MADTPSRGGVQGTYLNPGSGKPLSSSNGVFPSPYTVTYSYAPQGVVPARSVEGSNWFSPLLPMAEIAPKGVSSRQWDYTSGYNLITLPRAYHHTTFEALRMLADGYDLLRIVLETRKDQVKRLRWGIQPINRHTKKDVSDQVSRVKTFFQHPDGYHTFSEWIGMLIEDLLVVDAPTVFRQRSRSGKLLALHVIDGATIKPVIDDWGRIPQPYRDGRKTIYPTAFQQILKGYPAVNYSVRDLIYKPRNVRVHGPYGFSPCEQILATINLGLQRQVSQTAFFTQGTIPDAFVNLPDTWSADQIKAFQEYFDSIFEGDLGKKRKLKFLPGGAGAGIHQTKEPDLKAEFDDYLARIICFAFSISPTALTKSMNRASAQSQKAQSEEEGLVPIMQWVKELIDEIIQTDMDAPDVEFVYPSEDSVDESTMAVIIDGQVKAGIMSLNEARVKIGLDPMDDPAFNEPKVYTAMGYTPIGSNTPEGVKEMMAITGSPPQTQPGATAPKGTGPGKPANTKPKAQDGPGETARKLLEFSVDDIGDDSSEEDLGT